MSRAAWSILLFGLYMAGQGLLLFFVPDLLLGVLGIDPALDGWVRVVGIALMVLSVYYVWAAQSMLVPFFVMTIPTRIAQFFAFLWLVANGHLSAIVIGTAAIEALAALWTWWALRIDWGKTAAN